MSVGEFVSENLALILGVLAFAVFVVGLVFALRTENGRNTLAGAAVRVALAALALAERWIGTQLEPDTATGALDAQEHEIVAARRWLHAWLDRR
jgi:hypothetical protein